MLTVQETRRLIGSTTMTDKEVEAVRDSLRTLAEIAFEQWLVKEETHLISTSSQSDKSSKSYGKV